MREGERRVESRKEREREERELDKASAMEGERYRTINQVERMGLGFS